MQHGHICLKKNASKKERMYTLKKLLVNNRNSHEIVHRENRTLPISEAQKSATVRVHLST